MNFKKESKFVVIDLKDEFLLFNQAVCQFSIYKAQHLCIKSMFEGGRIFLYKE